MTITRLAAVLVLLGLAAAYGCKKAENPVGKQAPAFAAGAVNLSADVDLKKLGAKPIILYFFASW